MENRAILGADISKKTIDVALHGSGVRVRISNDASGFERLSQWLEEQGLTKETVFLVFEHTGIYSYSWEAYLQEQGWCFTKVSGLEIKLSQGLVRGKSDGVDAGRIARYGFEKRATLRATPAINQILQRLQHLSSLRERLVRQRAALRSSLREIREVLQVPEQDILVSAQQRVVEELSRQIKQVEQTIAQHLEQDASLQHNYELLQSIKGVGKVLALATLIATQNFTRFASSRKFACYCGCAPFEYSSGSSVRKPSKVSHLANKRLKTLLDLAAKSAIQFDVELKEYYQRRIQAGKSKRSTINVVRSKIIYRMFAVIKRQTEFVTDFQKKAA